MDDTVIGWTGRNKIFFLNGKNKILNNLKSKNKTLKKLYIFKILKIRIKIYFKSKIFKIKKVEKYNFENECKSVLQMFATTSKVDMDKLRNTLTVHTLS